MDTARAYAPETSLLHASHRRVVGGQYGVVLHLTSQEPDLPDQLILLSPNGTVEDLGDEPKVHRVPSSMG